MIYENTTNYNRKLATNDSRQNHWIPSSNYPCQKVFMTPNETKLSLTQDVNVRATPTLSHLRHYLDYQYPASRGDIPLTMLCGQITELARLIKQWKYEYTQASRQCDALKQQVEQLQKTNDELVKDKLRLEWLEQDTNGCQNRIVLVHNFDRHGSCRATIDHAISAAKQSEEKG